jgi:predicted nucleic acid-binding protein
MNVIIDANIIFSSLIKEGKTQELMINLSLSLYAPEFLFEEIERNDSRKSKTLLKFILLTS